LYLVNNQDMEYIKQVYHIYKFWYYKDLATYHQSYNQMN